MTTIHRSLSSSTSAEPEEYLHDCVARFPVHFDKTMNTYAMQFGIHY